MAARPLAQRPMNDDRLCLSIDKLSQIIIIAVKLDLYAKFQQKKKNRELSSHKQSINLQYLFSVLPWYHFVRLSRF